MEKFKMIVWFNDPFKTQQHDPVKLLNTAEGQSVIEESHRKAFKAFTGVELSCRDNYELHICVDCAEMLKVVTELRTATIDVQ